MGRILDKVRYEIKEAPVMQDYFIGTDSQDNGKTVNFEISTVASVISGAGQPDRIISGAPVWIVGTLSFYIPVITYWLGGNLLYTEPITVTLNDGDEFDPRKDVIAVTIDSTIHVEEGIASPDPALPTLPNGNDYLQLTFVDIAAGGTVPTGASSETIYDEYVGEPNEYTVTETTGATRITLDNQVEPNTFDKCIYLVAPEDSDSITLLNDTLITANPDDTLVFAIRVEALWRNNSRMYFTFYKNGSPMSNSISLRRNAFGFISTLEQEYQLISIPFSEWTFGQADFNSLVITFQNLDNGSVFRLDTISRSIGIVQPPQPDVYVLPIATDVILGGVMVDNTTIFVDGSGVLSAGVSSTGLEAIDETNGIGWRLIGRNPAQADNIGLNAVDFGYYFGLTTQGATGQASVNFGADNIAFGFHAYTQGYNNNVSGYGSGAKGDTNIVSGTYSSAFGYNHNLAGDYNFTHGSANIVPVGADYSVIFGGGNTITAGAFPQSNFIIGASHTVADYSNLVHGYQHNVSGAANGAAANFVTGQYNIINGYQTSFQGAGLRGQGSYVNVVGMSNIDFTDNNTGSSVLERRLFVVGNGTIDGSGNRIVPSDAFRVHASGMVIAPDLTIAAIDAEATGKVLTTKEWVNNQGFVTDVSPFQTLNEGSGDGFVIRGSNRAQASNVGFNALDFGTAYLDNTQGASGYQSFTLGEDNKATGFTSVAFGYAVHTLDHYGFSSGAINTIYNRFSGAIGTGLITRDYGMVAVGQSNIDHAVTSGFNHADSIRFTVGVGDISSGVPVSIGTRRDGFIVYHDGRLLAPELTVAKIDAEATGRVLVTREWVEANSSVEMGYAASDELSDLEVVDEALRFRMPFAMTLTNVIITVNVGATGSKIICDLTKDGTTVLSTLVSIDAEVSATGTVDLTAGTDGDVSGITVDGVEIMSGAETWTTSLSVTATNVAANITANTSAPNYTAVAVGTLITITSELGGAGVNGLVVVSTTTLTMTSTDVNMAGGLTEETSNTASVPVVISDSALTIDSEISLNIDQIGSVDAGSGLKVWLIGTKA